MKTVFICHNYKAESFSSMSFCLANQLVEEGYRVVFISKDPYFPKPIVEKKEAGELILTSWPSKIKSSSFRDFKWFYCLYKKYRPIVNIGHHNGSIVSNIIAKVLGGNRTKRIDYHHINSTAIIEEKGGLNPRLRFFFFRKFLFYHLFCDQVICPSNYAKEDLNSFFKYSRGKVILNSIPDRPRKLTTKGNKDLVIGFLGRLDRNKNVLSLIEAFSRVANNLIKTKLKLRIAGAGLLEKEVQKKADSIDGLTFLGSIPYSEVNDFLGSLDYLIIPSKSDVLPTVGLEALMNSVPLIITPQVGFVDYLQSEKEVLITNGDVESLELVLKKILEFSDQEYLQLKMNARIAFEKSFQIESYVISMRSFLKL